MTHKHPGEQLVGILYHRKGILRFMRSDLHTRQWQKLRLIVLERDHWTCQVCGRQLVPGTHGAHVDHIVPHAYGGTNALENLRALCYRCNTQRGARQKRGWRISMPHARPSRFE